MISRFVRLLIAGLAASFLAAQPSNAAMLPGNTCIQYNMAVESGSKIATPVVPDRLLVNWQDALTCLVPIIGSLSSEIKLGQFSPEAQSKYLSATGAIRTLMTQFSALDEKLKTKTLDQLISKFNGLDDLDVVSVLSYGTRSDNRDMRVNSVVILGNVIANNTTCVPLTHLNDPKLVSNEAGVNGRANLLAIVSIVAQRAKKQNYDSIKATRDFIDNALSPKTNPSLQDTYRVLDEIQKRLNNPAVPENRNKNLEPSELENCRNYIKNYKPTIEDTSNLKY
jgi:hypothetical protein